MKVLNAILVVTSISSALTAGAPAAERACQPVPQSEQARLSEYVKKKFKLPEGARVETRGITALAGGCHRKVQFRSVGTARPFEVELYLSPDRRYLSREILDTQVDPIEEERRKEREFLAGLNANGAASIGPSNAPVTLTVFSDFQCPYCAKLAAQLTYDVLPAERQNVRVVFRHFPLSNHLWARRAAEATACAQEQGDKFFWALHNYVFEKQRELTPENAVERLVHYSNRLWGFDRRKFEECVAEHRTAAKIERDLAFGKVHGINGTPTMFLNGRRIEVGGDAVQIRSLIRQFSEANRERVAGSHSAPFMRRDGSMNSQHRAEKR